jgi:hypothetical protein
MPLSTVRTEAWDRTAAPSYCDLLPDIGSGYSAMPNAQKMKALLFKEKPQPKARAGAGGAGVDANLSSSTQGPR